MIPAPPHCPIEREEACDRPACREYVPPVEGDVLRRRPACARVLAEVVAMRGGTTYPDIEWLLGIPPGTARVAAQSGLAKLRRRLRAEAA